MPATAFAGSKFFSDYGLQIKKILCAYGKHTALGAKIVPQPWRHSVRHDYETFAEQNGSAAPSAPRFSELSWGKTVHPYSHQVGRTGGRITQVQRGLNAHECGDFSIPQSISPKTEWLTCFDLRFRFARKRLGATAWSASVRVEDQSSTDGLRYQGTRSLSVVRSLGSR